MLGELESVPLKASGRRENKLLETTMWMNLKPVAKLTFLAKEPRPQEAAIVKGIRFATLCAFAKPYPCEHSRGSKGF